MNEFTVVFLVSVDAMTAFVLISSKGSGEFIMCIRDSNGVVGFSSIAAVSVIDAVG